MLHIVVHIDCSSHISYINSNSSSNDGMPPRLMRANTLKVMLPLWLPMLVLMLTLLPMMMKLWS